VARLTALDTSQRADFERERDRADRTAGELAATRDTLTADLANLRDALATMTAERDSARARAAQVEALQAVLEIERQRVTEWQAVADRWATQAERRRGFLGWFRRAS
jgi:chromosome segregation ATPase